MSTGTLAARVTRSEAGALRDAAEHLASIAADPVKRAEHRVRARYWSDRLDLTPKPVETPRFFHAYTHDAEGNLVRLG